MRCRPLLILAVATGALAAPVTVYVSPTGDDAGPGTEAQPFRTLTRARDALRAKDGGPKTVLLMDGVHKLSEPLRLGREDGGSAAQPVTWEAAPGARPVLRGGQPVTGWTPWRDGILKADLAAQGLAGARFHQLFYQADDGFTTRQILARHPNFDPAQPRYGGWLYVDEAVRAPAEHLQYRAGDIPWEEWPDASQAEIVSTYNHGWQHAITPILAVDREPRVIRVRKVRGAFQRLNRYFVQNVLAALDQPGEWYHDRATDTLYFRPPNDRLEGDVIVPTVDSIIELTGTIPYPHGYLNTAYTGPRDAFPMPADAPPDSPVTGIRFVGLDLEIARQDGLRMVGADGCEVIRCRVTNVGNIGVNLGGATSSFPEVGNPRVTEDLGHALGAGGGGQILLLKDPARNCRVIGCDVWETGAEGLMLFGTGNLAENNHVWDNGRYAKDAPCVNLLGEGNVARRNSLHDSPRCTIFIKGVDNVAELNDNHHANLETTDMGAIRFVQRNAHLKGNVVRHNIVTDSIGYGFAWRAADHYQSPFYTWGIYLDDYTCGTVIEGNIVTRTARGGIMVHGGGDNLIRNNLVYNAGPFQLEFAPIQADGAGAERVFAGNRVERNILLATEPDQFPYRFTNMPADPPSFANNLIWTGDEPVTILTSGWAGVRGWPNWLALGLERDSTVAKPELVELHHGIKVPKIEGPVAAMGFEPIPVERIGCFEDPQRASWPLSPDRDRPREAPLLPAIPGYDPASEVAPRVIVAGPVEETFESSPVGQPPATGDVLAPGASRIRVTDAFAASGQRSLEIVDAEGLPFEWQPRIYWPLDFVAGTVRLALDLRLDGERPPSLYLDPRDYTAGGEYGSGPILTVAGGKLIAEGLACDLPADTWIHLELLMPLGDQTSTLTVRSGGEPRRFEVRHRSPKFRRLSRLVIASVSTEATRFWIDNLRVQPADE